MAGVVNDPDGLREMFLDNRDACPELLDILEEELNVLAGGTCTNNRKLFSLKDIFLTLLMGCKRGTPNYFTIVASVLLLHNGKIPRHSNSSAVSVN